MSIFRVTVRAAVLPLVLSAAYSATDPLYKSLRDAPLADSFVVENVVIKRDTGVLTLKTGSIAFTPLALGRDTVAIFVGEGEFTFQAVSPIDRGYMVSLTGQDRV